MRVPGLPAYWCDGGELVVRRLHALGVEYLFSIAGAQVLPVWDAVSRLQTIRLVVPRSERNAALMGEGFALAAGRPAVVMSTLGPGVANEAVGVFSALQSRAPVLFICPDQPRDKRARIEEVFQGLDHGSFFAGLCKASHRVDSWREIPTVLDAAFAGCLRVPSGPVRVDISFPLLFQSRMTVARRPPAWTASERTRDIIVVSELSPPSGLRVLEALGLHVQEGDLLGPGIGTAGFAMPFAVGAKLAQPQVPVVLVTSRARVVEHLDSLLIAQSCQIPVHLIALEDADTETLGRVATVSRARLSVRPDPQALDKLVHADKRGLSVVCSEREGGRCVGQ